MSNVITRTAVGGLGGLALALLVGRLWNAAGWQGAADAGIAAFFITQYALIGLPSLRSHPARTVLVVLASAALMTACVHLVMRFWIPL